MWTAEKSHPRERNGVRSASWKETTVASKEKSRAARRWRGEGRPSGTWALPEMLLVENLEPSLLLIALWNLSL